MGFTNSSLSPSRKDGRYANRKALDSLPAMLFVAAHIIFLLVGLWAFKKAKDYKYKFASAFWLYVASQIVFLSFFGGILTMKMAVLLEQTLMVLMVLWIVMQKSEAA